MKNITICMMGFGNVGKAFARLIQRKSDVLASDYDITLKIIAITTGSHGNAINPTGIDLDIALKRVHSPQRSKFCSGDLAS